MSKIIKGVYKRRRPEQTDYYRIIEHFHDGFIGEYTDSFESRYGWLKQETMNAVYSFLDCGIPENGVARIRCGDCGNDYFIAFSCRKRNVCPSCSTKRGLLFAEKIEEIVKPVKHVHITFTIPKLLRAY
ncbi:MAG: transposase zinc-binding domain-containing protein, partial [Nitrospinae bacterium]|nr:transposase zinc-binding domain-containing protein [Nitrospinota bacterium]